MKKIETEGQAIERMKEILAEIKDRVQNKKENNLKLEELNEELNYLMQRFPETEEDV